VDEIYDAVIVRPLVFFSESVLWKGVDQGVIDGAGVTGLTASLAGWAISVPGSRMAYVGRYVFWFVVAVVRWCGKSGSHERFPQLLATITGFSTP